MWWQFQITLREGRGNKYKSLQSRAFSLERGFQDSTVRVYKNHCSGKIRGMIQTSLITRWILKSEDLSWPKGLFGRLRSQNDISPICLQYRQTYPNGINPQNNAISIAIAGGETMYSTKRPKATVKQNSQVMLAAGYWKNINVYCNYDTRVRKVRQWKEFIKTNAFTHGAVPNKTSGHRRNGGREHQVLNQRDGETIFEHFLKSCCFENCSRLDLRTRLLSGSLV